MPEFEVCTADQQDRRGELPITLPCGDGYGAVEGASARALNTSLKIRQGEEPPVPTLPPAPVLAPIGFDVAPTDSCDCSDFIEELLNAIPKGSSITFSSDQLQIFFSCGGRSIPAPVASARAEHLAFAHGCSFSLKPGAGTAIFTKHNFYLESPADDDHVVSFDAAEAIGDPSPGTTAVTIPRAARIGLLALSVAAVTVCAANWIITARRNHEVPPGHLATDLAGSDLPKAIALADQPARDRNHRARDV
jgi:hypothetical protein